MVEDSAISNSATSADVQPNGTVTKDLQVSSSIEIEESKNILEGHTISIFKLKGMLLRGRLWWNCEL